MTNYSYIVLEDDIGNLSKRFRVISSGYRPVLDKASNMKRSVGGSPDISVGQIYEMHQYIVKVYGEDPDGSDYGTIDDLRTLYRLNNPNGSPSCELIFTDHFGAQKLVYMMGSFEQDLLSVMLEGEDSVWIVQIVLQVIGDIVS